ncbi:MAG: hypothetical protein R3A10_09475 [Caldilineaceae bacterium]
MTDVRKHRRQRPRLRGDAVTAEHLGLTIMRERAEGVHALLEVQSEIGKGTRITVTWPGAVQPDVTPPDAVMAMQQND